MKTIWNRDVGLALLTVLAGVWGVWFMTQTFVTGLDGKTYYALFDDGMISMRYARMLVAGHGLVWNVGEYVEGYTNPLWTLVMAACVAVFGAFKAPLAVQVLGWLAWLGCGLAAAGVAQVLVRNWKLERRRGAAWVPVLAAVLVWAYYPLAYWSMTGMEAGPLALVALLTAWVVLARWRRGPSQRSLWSLLGLGAVAYGLRPDGVLVVILPLAAWWLMCAWRRDWHGLARLSALAVAVGLVMATHIVWRHAYYGEWIPNTYLLKMVGDPASHRLANGAVFMGMFMKSHWLMLVMVALMVGLVRRLEAVVLAGTLVLVMAYQTWAGGDPWPYWRQLVPGVAMVAPLLAAGVVVPRKVWLSVGLLVAVVAGWGLAILPFRLEMTGQTVPYQLDATRDNLRTAQVLQQVLAPDAVVAVVWGGTLPYYWPGPAYDLLGKTNKEVASLPVDLEYPAFNGMKGTVGHNHHDFGRVLTQVRPDYTQEVAWGPKDDHWDLVRAGQYHYLKVNGLELFLRADARLAPGVMMEQKPAAAVK